jgi:hypothetical protein
MATKIRPGQAIKWGTEGEWEAADGVVGYGLKPSIRPVSLEDGGEGKRFTCLYCK